MTFVSMHPKLRRVGGKSKNRPEERSITFFDIAMMENGKKEKPLKETEKIKSISFFD